MKWIFVGSSIGDKFIIDGIDNFKEEWQNTGKHTRVTDDKLDRLCL